MDDKLKVGIGLLIFIGIVVVGGLCIFPIFPDGPYQVNFTQGNKYDVHGDGILG